MQKALVVLVVFVAILVAVLLTQPQDAPASATDPAVEKPLAKPSKPPQPNPFPETTTTLAIAEYAGNLNSESSTIHDDFSHILLLLSQYRRHLGTGNPVGDNAEVTAALLGRNAKGIAYLPASGSFMDSQGRLLDRWGTPYFFHAITGQRMQIHSAGPDRKLHTTDDAMSEF